MKYTITSTCDLTWDEGVDFHEITENHWPFDEDTTYRSFTQSGEDKDWLLGVHDAIRDCPDHRVSYEFIFKRTSKKRFEFSLIHVYWPEGTYYPEVGIEELSEPERTVAFKWIAEQPCWVLMEAIKRQTGYYLREDATTIPPAEHGHWDPSQPF